jgi:hypothetical protein
MDISSGSKTVLLLISLDYQQRLICIGSETATDDSFGPL